jgi:hypothetical protein
VVSDARIRLLGIQAVDLFGQGVESNCFQRSAEGVPVWRNPAARPHVGQKERIVMENPAGDQFGDELWRIANSHCESYANPFRDPG